MTSITRSLTIGFIENRDRTTLWNAVAQRLIAAGHRVCWLVQNHAFMPTCGTITRVPYPRQSDLAPISSVPALAWLAHCDRGAMHFQAGTDHYAYYSGAVQDWLMATKPDVVFGECTLFHELLAIYHAVHMGIRYIEPAGTRYPTGQLTFHYYPDLQLATGRNAARRPVAVTDAELDTQIANIVSRAVTPAYLTRKTKLTSSPTAIIALARIAVERYAGERYNTPSPRRKWVLQRQLKANLAAWDQQVAERWAHRSTEQSPDCLRVLLPLQMQPESNLDSWGDAAFRDQAKFAGELARLLNGRGELWIKANPHAKYEMTSALIATIQQHANIIPVPRNLNIGGVWADVQGAVTVTGTVAVEALLADKPVYALSHYLKASAPNAQCDDSLARFPEFLNRLLQPGAGVQLTTAEKRTMMRSMHECSFPGEASDPRSNPACMAPANVQLLAAAFLYLLADLPALPCFKLNQAPTTLLSAPCES